MHLGQTWPTLMSLDCDPISIREILSMLFFMMSILGGKRKCGCMPLFSSLRTGEPVEADKQNSETIVETNMRAQIEKEGALSSLVLIQEDDGRQGYCGLKSTSIHSGLEVYPQQILGNTATTAGSMMNIFSHAPEILMNSGKHHEFPSDVVLNPRINVYKDVDL